MPWPNVDGQAYSGFHRALRRAEVLCTTTGEIGSLPYLVGQYFDVDLKDKILP